MEAVFPDDGYYYPAAARQLVERLGSRFQVVTKVGEKFTVKWDDPDGGPEESEVEPKEMTPGKGLQRLGSRPEEVPTHPIRRVGSG